MGVTVKGDVVGDPRVLQPPVDMLLILTL